MKYLFPTVKDLEAALLAGLASAFVYVGNSVAGGFPLDWKAFAVAVVGVFVTAAWQRLLPYMPVKVQAKLNGAAK